MHEVAIFGRVGSWVHGDLDPWDRYDQARIISVERESVRVQPGWKSSGVSRWEKGWNGRRDGHCEARVVIDCVS